MPTCETCRFGRKRSINVTPNWLCRRYPTYLPKRDFDWCGEHQPKENTDASSD